MYILFKVCFGNSRTRLCGSLFGSILASPPPGVGPNPSSRQLRPEGAGMWSHPRMKGGK